MKKWFAFLLVCSIILTCLAGCSGTPGEKETETETTAVERTKIMFYAQNLGVESAEFVENTVNAFNNDPENTDVYVELKLYDSTNYNDSLTIARENGNCPDLFFASYSSLPQDVREDNVAPLTDLFDASVWEDIYPNVLEYVTFNDQVYAFPWFSEPSTLLYYRKDVLSSLGYESAPKTFDELYEVCEAVKATLPIGQYALGLPLGASEMAWRTWGIQQNLTGGLAVTEDWMTSRLSDPGYKELCRFYYTCTKEGYCSTSDMGNLDEVLFYGNAMMVWGGGWTIGQLYEMAEAANDYSIIDKIGVAPIPTLSGDENATTATNGGWCYVISSLSSETKQKAAAKFLQWLFVDNHELVADGFVAEHMSRSTVSKQIAEYLTTIDTGVNPEWLEVINDVSSKAVAEARFPWDVSYEVSFLIQNCVEGSGSFDLIYRSALEEAEANLETIMSRKAYIANPWYSEGE